MSFVVSPIEFYCTLIACGVIAGLGMRLAYQCGYDDGYKAGHENGHDSELSKHLMDAKEFRTQLLTMMKPPKEPGPDY